MIGPAPEPVGDDARRGGRGPLDMTSLALATGLGTGLLRPAPGTIGSAAGVASFALLLAPREAWFQLLAGVLLVAVGCWACRRAAPLLGSSDPADIVIDEWAAMWLAMVGLETVGAWTASFFLFRLFDIVKPFPAAYLDRMSERIDWFGIMADDVVAAVYAQAALRAGLYVMEAMGT